jgi:hypothetical protein
MMLAYGRGARQITLRHVVAAARDTLAAKPGWMANALAGPARKGTQ